MTIANAITFCRILIGPLFLLLYLYHDALHISFQSLPYCLLFLLIVSETSDGLDGYLARRYKEVTDLGKILDPMADSIYRISVFLTFTQPPVKLPMLLIFVFLYRDSIISTLRTVCALSGFALGARFSGKLKAIIQASATLAIVLLLLLFSQNKISLQTLQSYSFWITAAAALYTVLSGIEYMYTHRELIRKSLRPQEHTQQNK